MNEYEINSNRHWARWELLSWAKGQMLMDVAQLGAAIREALDEVPFPNMPPPHTMLPVTLTRLEGCCRVCEGTGHTAGTPCWDCQATGHYHEEGKECI